MKTIRHNHFLKFPAIALVGLLCGQAAAQEALPYLPNLIDVDLPADVESTELRFRRDVAQNAPGDGQGFRLDLSDVDMGPTGYLLGVDVVSSGPSGCPIGSMESDELGHFGLSFRHYMTRRIAGLQFTLWNYDDEAWDRSRQQGCEIVISVVRRPIGCFMSAQYSGDLSGTVFGDVAYFNTATAENPLASQIDPGSVAMLESLLGMAATGQQRMYGNDEDEEEEEACDDNGENCEPLPDAPTPSFGDALEGWAAQSEAAGDDMPAGYRDPFGISMTDVKFSDKNVRHRNPDRSNRPEMDVMGQVFGGMPSFSLGGTSAMTNLQGNYAGVSVPLSTMYMLPGDLDANLSGVKFRYVEGETPGAAIMTMHGVDTDSLADASLLLGTIDGQLRSERRYRNGYLNIRVVATFVARRGALSCQGQR